MQSPGSIFRLRGFTLVELMISIAIILSLTIMLLWRYPETSIRLTLANLTHTTSLLVREAQVRGSAIDSANSSLGGYGVYFSLAFPGRLVLFGDTVDVNVPKPYGITVGNGFFESGTPINETKTTTNFPEGYVIKRLCVGTGFPFTCNSSNTPAISSLTVSFTRPNPAPSIYVNNSVTPSASAACIELRSPEAPNVGHIRNVQVFASGMIRNDVGKCDNDPL
jgi:prepilin-type N-terminal cleavage/methylation domain-containing protein